MDSFIVFKNIFKYLLTILLFILYNLFKVFLNRGGTMGLAETFKALSDPQRRDILILLRDGKLNAGEISEKLGITPAALSYHLRLLKKCSLIMEYKDKNFIYYELNTGVFDEILLWFGQFGGQK